MRLRAIALPPTLAAAALAAAACGGTDGAQSADDKTIKIGMSAALAGQYATYDQPFVNGMKFAEKEINAKGGIDGYKVDVIVKNNKGDQTQTAAGTQELLEQGVRVVVLPAADTYLVSARLALDRGAVVSVGANSAPAIVKGLGDRGVMFVYGDNTQAAAGAEYSCKQGYRSAYLIGSDEIPYTKFIPRYFQDAFAKDCDGRIVGRDAYRIGQTSFSAQVAKIAAARPKPDVIYTPMFVPDFGAFMKELRSEGVTIPVVTVEGNATPLLMDSAGAAANGVALNASAFPTGHNAAARFLAEYKRVMGKPAETDSLEALGRDNVYAIVQAAARAKSTQPDKLLAQIYRFKDLPLVTGKVTMDRRTRVPEKEVVLLRVVGRKFQRVATIRPSYVPAP